MPNSFRAFVTAWLRDGGKTTTKQTMSIDDWITNGVAARWVLSCSILNLVVGCTTSRLVPARYEFVRLLSRRALLLAHNLRLSKDPVYFCITRSGMMFFFLPYHPYRFTRDCDHTTLQHNKYFIHTEKMQKALRSPTPLEWSTTSSQQETAAGGTAAGRVWGGAAVAARGSSRKQ